MDQSFVDDGAEARAFFDANGSGKVDELLKQPNRQAWEAVSCSQHSPGKVADEEQLMRQLSHPFFVDRDTQEIKAAAFNDVFNHGMSVERSQYWSEQDARERGLARAHAYNQTQSDPTKHRTFVAFAVLIAGEVRSLKSEPDDQRCLAVYDTALEDVPAHADVCMIAAKTELNKRRVRTFLTLSTKATFLE